MPSVQPSVCPLDCPDRCSLDVTVDGGRVVKITGSHRYPFTAGYICSKVRHFDRRLHSPERILTPGIRTGEKGRGAFRPCTWEEALSTVADRFAEIARTHGPEAILPFSYGGSNGLLTSHGMDERLWNRLGASQLQRTFCAANTGAAWKLVFDDLPGADPADVADADAIVLWGVNPSVSGIHLVPAVRQAQSRGALLAVVDPRRTPLAAKADFHLPVLPGTDVAAALALVHEVLTNGLEDRPFLEAHARGLEPLTAAAAAWTPERAAALCGIDAALLRTLPRELARRERIFFRVGWGLERNRNGTDAVRAVLALRAILGRFRGRGSGVALSTSAGYRMDFSKTEGVALRAKPARMLNMSQLGRLLEETVNPPIRGLFVYNANPLATAPNQGRLERALRHPDLFTVVHEQVLTDTAAYADVVLPATTFLEHRELCRSYGGFALQWSEAVVKPIGEARPNHAVFAALARALGFDEPEFAETEEGLARTALAGIRRTKASFEELVRARCVPLEPLTQFVDAFPSRGYLELAGPEPPKYRPAPVDAHLPLALVSPASDRAISSTLFEGLPPGEGRLSLSPADALARGLTEGERVSASNSLGTVVATLAIDPSLPQGVASMPKGLWRRATQNGFTANALAPDHVDERGGGACYNDARVEVERAPTRSA